MRELQKKNLLRKKIYSLPALFILFLVALLSIKSAYDMIAKERESLRETRELALEYERLRLREGELREEFERLKTLSGIEEEIKSKFNVAKPGEMVAVIVDDEVEESVTTPPNKPWWKRFWGVIIGE